VKSPSKAGYYVLEGLNSFATAYYFNYLMFLLKRDHGFGDLHNLAVGAAHGLLYVGASWFAGRFGQRHGYFTSLRIGFVGMAASMALGWFLPVAWGQIVALLWWTGTMCFTWPMLEALVVEHEDRAHVPNRVGLYNVVWAATAAIGLFIGGSIFERLGHESLYWLPLLIHGAQLAITFPLERAHDRWLAAAPPVDETPEPEHPVARPAYFQKLGWIGNPFAYTAINTLLAMVPGIAGNAGLGIEQAGRWLSIWYLVRTVSFGVLWRWPGWHYHFGWFAGAFALLIGGFAALLTGTQIWVLVLAQIAFGWATALLYYSSLFYAMDGSDTKAEHGGLHEAFIGAGICGGPAVSFTALWLTRQPNAPAMTVGGLLLGGLATAWWVRRRALAPAGR
jgi:MFS family permease